MQVGSKLCLNTKFLSWIHIVENPARKQVSEEGSLVQQQNKHTEFAFVFEHIQDLTEASLVKYTYVQYVVILSYVNIVTLQNVIQFSGILNF